MVTINRNSLNTSNWNNIGPKIRGMHKIDDLYEMVDDNTIYWSSIKAKLRLYIYNN